jgi:subtilisin family serine protease
MKKNTVKGTLVIVAILAGGVSVFAQAPNAAKQRKVNDSLSFAFEKIHTEQKTKALEMAKVKGWPVTIEKEDSFAELMAVTPEGEPLYYKTSNAGSALTSRVSMLYPGGGLNLNLTGEGVLGGIWDGGKVMVSHTTFDLPSRVTPKDGLGTSVAHATHVAGTMVGSGGSSNPNARGMAYDGKLWSNNWDNDDSEMAAQASSLVVSNHSYGLAASQTFPVYYFGKYVQDSQLVDQITFNNPKYQPVIAAGNDRQSGFNTTKSGKDLLTGQSVAKNAITVAAISQVSDPMSPTATMQIASFSNYGPTDDFRIKPDIADKGVNVFSSTNTGQTDFANMSGTSMASPGVSGAIMLIQQHYKNLKSEYMNSATLRALIANTANGLDTPDGPDYKTGWGVIDAAAAVQVISKDGTSLAIIEENTLTSGQTYTATVKSDGVNPLKVTIAWTDRAGSVSSNTVDVSTPLLVNDLDLRVTSSNTSDIFLPWKLNKSWANPSTTTGDNDVDNLEQVEVLDNPSGEYTITISHKDNLTGGSQAYSLIVTGIDQELSVVNSVKDMFNVWPNPANDHLNIHLQSADEAAVSIFDVQGRQVAAKKLAGQDDVINIDNLSEGVYFVKVVQGAKQDTKKIVVK